MRTYEVRLAPAATSDDPVDAASLADFLAALQTLFYRVTREAADRADLGRTARSLERTSLMRVSWAHPGALTVLVGDPDTLEIDPLADRVDRWVAQLIAAMATNRRPGAVTNPIADATDSLIKAMKALGSQVTFVLPGGGAAALQTEHVSRDPWGQTRAEPARTAAVTGRLEMVDLHSGRCRVRDRNGDPFDVQDAVNPQDAARLVGRLVTVSGVLLTGTGTQHHRIERGTVRAHAREPTPEPAQSRPLPLNVDDTQWHRFLDEHAEDL